MVSSSLISRQILQVILVLILGAVATGYVTHSALKEGEHKAYDQFKTDGVELFEGMGKQITSLYEHSLIIVGSIESEDVLNDRRLNQFIQSHGRTWSTDRTLIVLQGLDDHLLIIRQNGAEDGLDISHDDLGSLKQALQSQVGQNGNLSAAFVVPENIRKKLQIGPALLVALSFQFPGQESGMILNIQEFSNMHERAFKTETLAPLNLEIRGGPTLTANEDASGPDFLIFSADAMGRPLDFEKDKNPPKELSWSTNLDLLNLTLTMIVRSGTLQYHTDYKSVFLTGAIGLILTVALAYWIWNQSRQASRVADMVHRRTRALKQAHNELEDQYGLLQRLNLDLEESRKTAEMANAAKSEFLATVSHELRTPLNAILGFSQIIKDETLGSLGDKRYRDYAVDIHDSGAHLLSLINDILDLAKLEAGKIKLESAAFRASEMADRVISIMAQAAEQKSLTLSLDVKTDLPEQQLGDELRIRQILINLVSNAIKYTQEGDVAITLYTEPFGAGSPGWIMEVRDTGVGIPAGKLETLFERFTQVESTRIRKQGGAGLGLSICRELCEMMGGTIRVESDLDKGSVFSVHLPLHAVEESGDDDEDDGFI